MVEDSMGGDPFYHRYLALSAAYGRSQSSSPRCDIERWLDFVECCEGGFDDVLAEYDFELGLRGYLAYVLNDRQIQAMPGFTAFARAVEAIDERLRGILVVEKPDASSSSTLPWWHAKLPAYGQAPFVEDVQSRLGVDLYEVKP